MIDDMSFSHSEVDLVRNCNDLLVHVGLDVKQLSSYKELTRAAPSLLVAVYESLFQERLPGIMRSPMVLSDYANNAQCVIDGLSKQIQMGLQHINGEAVAKGEFRALTNVFDIIRRIVSITRGSRLRQRGMALSDDENLGSGSISTRDSFFEDMEDHDLNMDESQLLVEGMKQVQAHSRDTFSDNRGRNEPLKSRETKSFGYGLGGVRIAVGGKENTNNGNRLVSSGNRTTSLGRRAEVDSRKKSSNRGKDCYLSVKDAPNHDINSPLALMAQEEKLASAKQRRDKLNECRGHHARTSNSKKQLTTQKILQQRWRDDKTREARSHECRCTNAKHVLQRQIFKRVLKRITEIKRAENAEKRERIQKLKEETDCHIKIYYLYKSLQNLFMDKMNILREKEDEVRNRNESRLRAERRRSYDYFDSRESKKNQDALSRRESLLQQSRDREFNSSKELPTETFINSLHVHEPSIISTRVPVEAMVIPTAASSTGSTFALEMGGPVKFREKKEHYRRRREVQMQLDKQVCDLVRQQQHDSMSFGWKHTRKMEARNELLANQYSAPTASTNPTPEKQLKFDKTFSTSSMSPDEVVKGQVGEFKNTAGLRTHPNIKVAAWK